MILHEYAILPFEIGRKISKRAHKQAEKTTTWTRFHTLETDDDLAFHRSDPIKLPCGSTYDVYLIFIDTSACFLFHRIKCQPPQVNCNMAKEILIERNLLNNDLLNKEGNSCLAKVLEELSVTKWRQTEASYVFNFCVLEMDGTPTKESLENLKIISDRSVVGINDNMKAHEINQLDFKSRRLTRLKKMKDIDPYPHTTIYATWSSVVAVTWGDKKNADATKQMLVKMEIGLQSIWNHSYQLNLSVSAFQKDKRKRSDKKDLLLTATRFLEIYKRRASPSSTSSTREVDVLNQLVATSRLDTEIGALESSLLKEYNYRRELGQGWITVLLVLLTAIGTTQVISDHTLLKVWEQHWWVFVIGIGIICLTFWLTVWRTIQERRNRLRQYRAAKYDNAEDTQAPPPEPQDEEPTPAAKPEPVP